MGAFCITLLVFVNPVFLHDIQYDLFYRGKPQKDPFNDPPRVLEYYEIDPSTILEEISAGKHNVFLKIEGEPDNYVNIYPSGTFTWSQEDYLAIAKAHHLYLTGEVVNGDWKVYGHNVFSVYQCQNNMQGFDGARFSFYKESPDVFLVTYMLIYPLKGMIYSTSTEYKRERYLGSRFLNNTDAHFYEAKALQGNITAEDALQIAENTKGEEIRNNLSNRNCSLSVSDFGDEYWHINYSWYTDDLIFDLDLNVNAKDGSYEISQNTSKCERILCP